jgi:DNA-binding LacI/PurR family transcriptional regulator
MPRAKQPSEPASTILGTRTKPVSLRDLAAHLDLSSTTISLVLNDSPLAKGISAKTRERVLQGAADLNYKPNYFARMLNRKRSCMVGVLSPDLSEGYDSEIIHGIERLLIERNYLYFVSSHHWNKALIRQRLEDFAQRGAEGMILINTQIESGFELPLVSIGSLTPDFPQTRIIVDNAAGIREGLAYLYALGHRHIAFFKGHAVSSDTESRWIACEETAQVLGLRIPKEHVVELQRIDGGVNPIREGYVAAEQLLQAKSPFTALLAFNDMSAIGAIHAFHDAGKRVPLDISVMGFDDVQAATIVQPSLTTVRQPLGQMGMQAAKEILASIEHPQLEPRRISIEPRLVIRQSTTVCLRR